MKRRDIIKFGLAGSIFPLSVQGFTQGSFRQENTGEIHEPGRTVAITGKYDVIICGAGPAGVAAAVEAGRNGSRVLLIEVQGCLGGIWTAGSLSWIIDHGNKPGIMREIGVRLEDMGAKGTIPTGSRYLAYNVEKMKLLLEMICLEAGVDILLHTRVVSAVKSNERLTHIVTESKSGRQAWEGKVFIDATGDGDLAAVAGCSFDFGDQHDNGAFQPMSLLALITGVRFDEIRDFVRWEGDQGSASKQRLYEEILKAGIDASYTKPGIYPVRDDMYMLMANHEYGYSALDAGEVTRATLHARKEIHAIVDGLKSLGGRWKDIAVMATGNQIGVREGRRIHGRYMVTQDDLVNGTKHEDAVCTVTFGVDVHSVRRSGDLGAAYSRGIRSKPYDIPLRALMARDINGLMMAGRCISGDFIAHSSYRVTGNSVAMGESAGRVAAIASLSGRLPEEVRWEEVSGR